MRKLPATFVLSALLCSAAPLAAATLIPPRDLGDLARSSSAVVLARALGSTGILRGGLILTRTELVASRVLSGPIRPGEVFSVDAPGGAHGDRVWVVPGSPSFVQGEEYLLFLAEREDGGWIPALLSYGLLQSVVAPDGSEQLRPIADGGLELLPPPDASGVERPGSYWKEPFLDHLSRVIGEEEAWDATVLRASEEGGGGVAPDVCVFITDQGRPFRWSTFDTGGSATIFADATGDDSVSGGPFGLIQDALDAWMQVPETSLNLLYGGEAQVSFDCAGDGGIVENTIVFNDPCGEMTDLDGCRGILAFGGPLQGATHTFDTSRWNTANGWIVVVNNGSGCLGPDNYRVMLSHELGHGLGFGHVADSSALMFASCCNNLNPTDRTCAHYTYPRPAGNARPRVQAGEDLTLTLAGDTLALDGSATDDGLPEAPGRLTVSWTLLGGPRGVRFSSPASARTQATFPISGVYVLGLRATDGSLLHADTITADLRVLVGQQGSVRFRQGESGYSGTVDTFLAESQPDTDLSRATELSIDADDPRSSGQSNQGLLRFDGLFGPGAGQIPLGAQVLSATLELSVTNGGEGATLHRMLKAWRDTDTWNSLGGAGLRLGTEVVSTADAASTGTVSPERITVTASLKEWARDPCESLGWAFLPRGTDGWDFISAEGAEPPSLEVEFQLPGRPLIAPGVEWTYWKGTAEPPQGWNEVDFEPGAGWLSGPAGLGYGDGDDATVLDDMQGRYVSLFLRRPFDADAATSALEARLTVVCDDGAVVYLNGEEIGRDNMPQGAATSRTPASATLEARAAAFRLPAGRLRAGRNVVAVSVHNADVTSSDLSFSAVLLPVAGTDREAPCGADFRRGDANGDGLLNLTDAVRTLDFLFRGGLALSCPDAADTDDDGRLLLTDAVRLLQSLFQGAGPLPAPAECGPDPTADALGDCESAACRE